MGALVKDPAHLIDLMATAWISRELTTRRNSRVPRSSRMEGLSLRAAFDGVPLDRKEPIFFEHEGNRAARDGDWKLVAKGRTGPWELYDMRADRTELHNLATAQPEKVKELAGKWETWAERAHVKPYPEGGGGKGRKAKQAAD